MIDLAPGEYQAMGMAVNLSFLKPASNGRELGHPITSIAFSQETETRYVTGNTDGDIQLWDRREIENPDLWFEKPIPKKQISKLPIRSVAMSGDGKLTAACDAEGCKVLRNSDFHTLLTIAIPEAKWQKLSFSITIELPWERRTE